MKIVLATCGSRGDVQPMIATSLALKAAGHDVLLIGPPEKAMWARQLRCPYMEFGQDVTAFLNQVENSNSLRSNLEFNSFVRREIDVQFKVLPRIIKNADLAIGSSLMGGLSSISEAMKIKYQYIVFTPQLIPSNFHPFIAVKTQTLPKWCNKLSWGIAKLLDKFNLTFLINQNRKRMHLEPLSNAWDHIIGDNTIVACDSQVAKVPLDVKPEFIQTGYPHLDLPDKPFPELDRFLETGTKPIYAGFGSMPPKEQRKNIPLLVKAARSLGKRIIISKFWKENSEYQFDKDVFFIKNYPHLKLFPKTDAVIHHGGAGTTATATVSGVPQVIIPHILDQYFHGHQIYLSSLGSKPVWRTRLTAEKLTSALKTALFSKAVKQNAKTAGSQIDKTISLKLIVKAVEQSGL